MTDNLWERLKVDRVHMAPRAFDLSPSQVQQRYRSAWAPLVDLLGKLRPSPDGLLRFWLCQPGGHVVITHLGSRYEEGERDLKSGPIHNVAYAGLTDLAAGSLEALVPVGRMLDHLLGSGGATDGPWLSEGGGVSSALEGVGSQIVRLFPLGYGFDALACHDVRSYFSRSLAMYVQDRRALNVADPHVERLLRTTLFSAAFWRSHQQRA
jgi:hypothetical protein